MPAGNITVPAGASIPAGIYGLPINTTGAAVTASQLSNTINYFNPAYDTTYIPQTSRKSIVGNLQQHVNENVKVWAEGYYTQNDIKYDGGQLQATANLPNTSPYFISLGPGITSESSTIGLDQYAGPSLRQGFDHGYQAAAGVDFDLSKSLQFNAYYEHLGDDVQNNQVLLNATAEKAAFACTNPSICYDPYGSAPGNAAAAATFLGYQNSNSHFRSDLVNAKVDGSVFTLPGGDVKLAIGGEYHNDSLLEYNTVNTSGATLATVVVSTNSSKSRSVYSGYVEAIVPIIGAGNAVSFAQQLQIDLAGRYDHYSDVGSTSNPKVGIKYKPIDDLAIHASYGTSFRAPTLCDTNPQCSATVSSSPAYGVPFNVLTVLGGNPAVRPETATTYSIGSDYAPSWLKGSRFSINYFNINYLNVIGTPAALSPAVFAQPALYASLVTLNPTQAQLNAVTSQPYYVSAAPFPITPATVGAIVNGTRQNAGQEIESGLDLEADYAWLNSMGHWDVGATATYLLEYKFSVIPGGGLANDLNDANYPVSIRGRAKFGWSNDNFGATAYVNYTGSYDVVQLVRLTPPQNQPVNAYTTVDGTLIYKTNTAAWAGPARNMTFSLSAQNLFNARAPFAMVATNVQFDSQNASALGRVITFGVHKTF